MHEIVCLSRYNWCTRELDAWCFSFRPQISWIIDHRREKTCSAGIVDFIINEPPFLQLRTAIRAFSIYLKFSSFHKMMISANCSHKEHPKYWRQIEPRNEKLWLRTVQQSRYETDRLCLNGEDHSYHLWRTLITCIFFFQSNSWIMSLYIYVGSNKRWYFQ